MSVSVGADLWGSSPLSRGIRCLGEVSYRHGRIIPALAGNTSARASHPRASRDHPRSRGEYRASGGSEGKPPGSSPLSRGIRILNPGPSNRIRIIPALAGNTQPATRNRKIPQDHPRSRGEYTLILEQGFTVNGSSPLSRGIPPIPCSQMLHTRIIPALAGNTRSNEVVC